MAGSAATSSQTELRLVNVARASQEELLLDYEDYLRHRRLPQWAADGLEAREVRQVPRNIRKDPTDLEDSPWPWLPDCLESGGFFWRSGSGCA